MSEIPPGVIPPEEVPVDFSNLDMRFLPFYLLSERVKIEWCDAHEHLWLISKNIETFYVGVELIGSYQFDYGDVGHHHHSIVFNRLRNKNSINGHDIESEYIKNVYGLGIHNQSIYAGMSMDQIIDYKLSQFLSLLEPYVNWVNYRGFVEAVEDFKNNECRENLA